MLIYLYVFALPLGMPTSPPPHQRSRFSHSLICAHLTSDKWNGALVCISPHHSETEHFQSFVGHLGSLFCELPVHVVCFSTFDGSYLIPIYEWSVHLDSLSFGHRKVGNVSLMQLNASTFPFMVCYFSLITSPFLPCYHGDICCVLKVVGAELSQLALSSIWSLFCEWFNNRDLIYLLMIARFQTHLSSHPFLPYGAVAQRCHIHVSMKVGSSLSYISVWHHSISLSTALEKIPKSFKVHPPLFYFAKKIVFVSSWLFTKWQNSKAPNPDSTV